MPTTAGGGDADASTRTWGQRSADDTPDTPTAADSAFATHMTDDTTIETDRTTTDENTETGQ
jgi:hypothetical protein